MHHSGIMAFKYKNIVKFFKNLEYKRTGYQFKNTINVTNNQWNDETKLRVNDLLIGFITIAFGSFVSLVVYLIEKKLK